MQDSSECCSISKVNVSKSMHIPNIDNHKVFIWSFLCLEELVMSPLNSPKGIAIAKETPYGFCHVNISRRAVLRQYYGKNVGYDSSANATLRYTYGYNKKNLSVNTDPTNFVTKPFSYYLLQLSRAVHIMLLKRKTELQLEDLDLSICFNHCTALIYFADKNLKPKSYMPFHCDVTYNHKGIYDEVLNEQVERTPSVIITLGDTRELKWQKQILMVNSSTGRMKWYNMHKSDFFNIVELGDKSIYIVNTLCERPVVDPDFGCFIRYQHGNVNVTKCKMSCGLVLRVVKNIQHYNDDNQLLNKSDKPSHKPTIFNDSGHHDIYHKNLQSLFMKTFKLYMTNV